LFCYPVVEEHEVDESEPPECDFLKKRGRVDLIAAAKVIIWDEFLSNHKDVYHAVHRATQGFQGKVLICMGDFRQIMPVVPRGNRIEQVNSCIHSSPLWRQFKLLKLSVNMRLQDRIEKCRALQISGFLSAQEYDEESLHIQKQMEYGKLISDVGEAKYDDSIGINVLSQCNDTGSSLCAVNLNFIVEPDYDQAFQFLFPHGFDPAQCKSTTILAATNLLVDNWNNRIQALNTNRMYELKSDDKFGEVDDPYGHISSVITEEMLNRFDVTGNPPHILRLKVGDICIVLRNLSMRDGLQNNTRVRILDIKKFSIRVQTLDDTPRSAVIPRIRFNFKLPFMQSYEISRLQFPLRLAYSMTCNKAQGQTMDRVLLDMTSPPFAHGHLYVALSRVTYYNNMCLFCPESHIYDGDVPWLAM
jgi:hypothetical protein